MPSPNRNESCPCGSGKKYKKCCAMKSQKISPALVVVLIAGVVLAIVVIVSSTRRGANAGLVWSQEHGHYHDASGREVAR
jgi:hypothetical protein